MKIFEKEERYILQTYKRYPLYVRYGSGKYVYDHRGRKYLDFFSGMGVCNMGHCHRKIVAAVRKQTGLLMHTSNLYYTLPQVQLAEKLAKASLGGKVFFSNSGAEANECAIKLARKNGGRRWKILSMTNSFHGRSLATLAATGQTKFHKGFEPMPAGFIHARFNDIKDVRRKLDRKVSGIIIEPVQGEGGVHPAQKSFIRELRKLCTARGILLIFDEVQCGLGRTGKLFAYEHYGVKPDVLTLAKSLGGGLPIGATVLTSKVAGIFARGDHGSTFGGNPVACAAGLTTLSLITPQLLRNVVTVGRYFFSRLTQMKRKRPSIRAVRGLGLMIGIELSHPASAIVERCRDHGLLINCTQETVLRFLPPFDITTKDVDHALDILDRVM